MVGSRFATGINPAQVVVLSVAPSSLLVTFAIVPGDSGAVSGVRALEILDQLVTDGVLGVWLPAYVGGSYDIDPLGGAITALADPEVGADAAVEAAPETERAIVDAEAKPEAEPNDNWRATDGKGVEADAEAEAEPSLYIWAPTCLFWLAAIVHVLLQILRGHRLIAKRAQLASGATKKGCCSWVIESLDKALLSNSKYYMWITHNGETEAP